LALLEHGVAGPEKALRHPRGQLLQLIAAEQRERTCCLQDQAPLVNVHRAKALLQKARV